MSTEHHLVDVAVIGGGQAGLAAGYFLRRAKADFAILDAADRPGGSWPEYWDSLRLFSPAAHSMLPGWWMPEEEGHEYPSAAHVAWYLSEYERRYDLPVHRPVSVVTVERAEDRLRLRTDAGTWSARRVISATGTWTAPYTPDVPGREEFEGRQLHTVDYRRPGEFAGQRVVVVGGGNSAAQILAELSTVATTTWATSRPPRFLPENVDGRVLFAIATRAQQAAGRGTPGAQGVGGLGDIVVVPSVREARGRGALKAEPMFERLSRTGVVWADGTALECDVVLWCTGFRPVLDHLGPLVPVDEHGRVAVEGTRSVAEPRLHLLGYGDWTGSASATLIGAARTAKATVAQITRELERETRTGTG
ncbi:ArsO family NAD(P)H-dependent flavin-containing monooxygenase [Nocardiopsis dassonvillei]|uniref:ArsO family NAD(P)H-dependent flavin-containing monooxygenase n=1 Tax=Nocardiopsis dassonvillei TaxID=2014 RepID=UPI00200F3974|nr:ArsO family NAD(P)H-dependent flavin-containing monooxygenase [Nocardiopsis dassonvillei]MCK9871324.1 ArsO family NAD(P)H-dependent flavin-containing monooxygenase [Nocardiopsis dassonvillei]